MQSKRPSMPFCSLNSSSTDSPTQQRHRERHSCDEPTSISGACLPLLNRRQSFLRMSDPTPTRDCSTDYWSLPSTANVGGVSGLTRAGYVDTKGKDFQAHLTSLSPGIWRYRDYVIDCRSTRTSPGTAFSSSS